MTAATPLITAADLRNALGPQLYLAVFDDENVGDTDIVDTSGQVKLVLRRAHMRTVSWLPAIYAGKLPDGTDAEISDLLIDAELLYAQGLAIERHPEYVKQYGETGRLKSWREQADSIMKDVLEATRRIADVPPEPKPANVGGIVVNNGPRVVVDNPDGSSNSGDF